jgi:alkylation response protein AidB-like acyl-CoA dehydrogenase
VFSFELSDEQRQMLDTVSRVRKDVIEPNAKRWLDGTFPHENMEALAETGILGMTVPEEYGGMGANVFDTMLVLEEIAKGCYVTSMAVLGEVGSQTRIISTFAPKSIKEKWLPNIAVGKAILAICMTEPDVGSDLGRMRTNAEIKGGKVILNGAKTLISRAEEADMFIVFTRVNGVEGSKGIGCILVEKGTPGLEADACYHTIGGEKLADLRFDNVEVPLENLVLKEGAIRKLMSAFNTQRCLNPSICLGMAEASLEASVQYMREREVHGHPIGDFQGLRWKISDMYIQIEAGRGLLYRAAASADPFPDPTLAAMAKIFVNEMSIKVCSEGVQIHGGYGFINDFLVARNYTGVRYGSLGGGTTELLRNMVGKALVERMDLTTGVAGMGYM